MRCDVKYKLQTLLKNKIAAESLLFSSILANVLFYFLFSLACPAVVASSCSLSDEVVHN